MPMFQLKIQLSLNTIIMKYVELDLNSRMAICNWNSNLGSLCSYTGAHKYVIMKIGKPWYH